MLLLSLENSLSLFSFSLIKKVKILFLNSLAVLSSILVSSLFSALSLLSVSVLTSSLISASDLFSSNVIKSLLSSFLFSSLLSESSLCVVFSLEFSFSISFFDSNVVVAFAIACAGKNSVVINATHIKDKSLFLLFTTSPPLRSF